METVTASGSLGDLTICANTGNVLAYANRPSEPDGDGYAGIVRVDLDEWRAFWRKPLHQSLDVLDLGSWDRDGVYSPAEADWREEAKRHLAENHPDALALTIGRAGVAALRKAIGLPEEWPEPSRRGREPDQEIWITVRLKGYGPSDMDANAMARHLLGHLESVADGVAGFTANVGHGDVIEVEEEATIYNLEA